MISILDVGCRYGVYPLFSSSYEKFDYLGVDVDNDEILRLQEKYNNKSIRFFSKYLGSENKKVLLNLSQHKGYNSTKKMNSQSIWFGSIRKDEMQVTDQLECLSEKSSLFISRNIKQNCIVKLDIEGGELEFLGGLEEKSFETIEAFIIEAHFDTPYESDSNFYSIGDFLLKKNYWAVSVSLENARINKFYESKDSIPLVSNVIFIKDEYKPQNFSLDPFRFDVICEVLYALKLEGLLLSFLIKNNSKRILKHRLFDEIKFMIGHKFNRLIKEPFINKEEIKNLFYKIFNESFPLLSDFYESDFFNP